MSDRELINALEASVDCLRREVSQMRLLHEKSQEIHGQLKEISDVRCQMRELIAQARTMGLATSLETLRTDISSLRTDINPTRTNVRLNNLEANLNTLKTYLKNLTQTHAVTRANLEKLYAEKHEDEKRATLTEEYSKLSDAKLIKLAAQLARPDNDTADCELRLEIISGLLGNPRCAT